MANKFTDSIKKNPNAKDPQGQQGFDKATWDKNQAAEQQRVEAKMKDSNLKEQVSKMKGNQKAPDNSKQKAPTHDR